MSYVLGKHDPHVMVPRHPTGVPSLAENGFNLSHCESEGGMLMTFLLFDPFNIEEATTPGLKLTVICKNNKRGYEDSLREGQSYCIEIVPGEVYPMCKVMGNDGVVHYCYLNRFIKGEEE